MLRMTLSCVLLMLLVAVEASAVDGVIEINQARALEGGVTTSDTPGFPVTLGTRGSYRLTGDLVVPNENTTGIIVAASDVTIDLNGFSIQGPVTGCPAACSATGSGDGIFGESRDNVHVINGTVRGMGHRGIWLNSPGTEQYRIANVNVVGNAGDGISALGIVAMTDCTAHSNGNGTGGDGIVVGPYSVVRGCVSTNNGARGIRAEDSGCALIGNRVANNGNTGILVDDGNIVMDNVAYQNGYYGIDAQNDGNTVVGNSASLNGTVDPGAGIRGGTGSTVTNNTASSNKGRGIKVNAGSTVTGNTVYNNTDTGIEFSSGCNLTENTVRANKDAGLSGNSDTGYAGNVIAGNTPTDVANGTAIGCNLINGVKVCP